MLEMIERLCRDRGDAKKEETAVNERREWVHRGLSLDVSRHFMPPEDIRRLLRAAAQCGVNRLHWHLADDQGWRVEIKRYPRLAKIGGRRSSPTEKPASSKNADGFYTQAEIRALVAFAGELGIDVIPEIEIPGHASAMLAAYPEYGCRRTVFRDGREQILSRGYDYRVMGTSGIFPNLICAGRDESIRFLTDILDEVMALFPFPAVHIGGDEALKQHWRRCPDCQARMRAEGLRDEEALQRWLMLKIGAHLSARGRSVIVYNDALTGGELPKHFIVQHWQGNDAETAAFTASGGRVICSDIEHFYFDYPYSAIDVKKLYEMPPIPGYCRGSEDCLLGFECMLWTEHVPDVARAARLLFPRLPAAMLRVTGDPACRTWDEYTDRLRQLREGADLLGDMWAPECHWDMACANAAGPAADDPQADREEALLQRQEALEKLLQEAGMPFPVALSAMDHAARDIAVYAGTPGSETLPGVPELVKRLHARLAARENDPRGARALLDDLKRFASRAREYHRVHGVWGIDFGLPDA